MIVARETYEQGTGRLIEVEDIEVPDTEPDVKEQIAEMRLEIDIIKGKVTKLEKK